MRLSVWLSTEVGRGVGVQGHAASRSWVLGRGATTGFLRAGKRFPSGRGVAGGGMALSKMSSVKARFGLHVLIVRRGRVIICNRLRWGGRRWRATRFVGTLCQHPATRSPRSSAAADEGERPTVSRSKNSGIAAQVLSYGT